MELPEQFDGLTSFEKHRLVDVIRQWRNEDLAFLPNAFVTKVKGDPRINELWPTGISRAHRIEWFSADHRFRTSYIIVSADHLHHEVGIWYERTAVGKTDGFLGFGCRLADPWWPQGGAR